MDTIFVSSLPTSNPFSMSHPDVAMLRSLDLSDVPELLVMMSKYLGTNTLSRAVQVSRQWHRQLLPELWSFVQLYEYNTRIGLANRPFLESLVQHGHFIRVLYLVNIITLDVLRQRPSHPQGNDFCIVNNLSKLGLMDYSSEDKNEFLGCGNVDQAEHRLIGLMLIARMDYENMNKITDRLAIASSSRDNKEVENAVDMCTSGTHAHDDGSYYTMDLLPSVHDEDDFDDIWYLRANDLIRPPYFDPLIHLLRHNRHLQTLTLHHFPSWSEQAIRAICREGLPILQELDLESERSAMVSTRLMRILLEGLTPKLRTLKLWISKLHEDDHPIMKSEPELECFWHQRYQGTCRNPKARHGPNNTISNEGLVELELAESYELSCLSINYQLILDLTRLDQEGALRSLVPFLRRCSRLERFDFGEFPRGDRAVRELTSTLYTFCPRLNVSSNIMWSNTSHDIIPSPIFEQFLLASRRGWKMINLGSVDGLSQASIRAFMGTGDGKDISTKRRLTPVHWISYPPSAVELALANLQEQRQPKDVAGVPVPERKAAPNYWSSHREPALVDSKHQIVIRPRLQILETVIIAGCRSVPSRYIQTILCSCPVLKKLIAITTDATTSTMDPYLMAQDMVRHVASIDGVFLDQAADSDTSQHGSALEPNEETDKEHHQRPKWACLGLEVLCLRIALSARPDVRVDMYNETAFALLRWESTNQKPTAQKTLDRAAMEACRVEQRLVYRELGRLQRLRKLRMGYCYPSCHRYQDCRPVLCDFLDTTSPDADHRIVAMKVENQSMAIENELVAPQALDSTTHPTESTAATASNGAESTKLAILPHLSGSSASRTIINATAFLSCCLEFSLDSGLELMLQGTPRLEILEVPQMATRIGLKEVQAMAAAWPQLKVLGLRSEADIDWKDELEFEIRENHAPTTLPRPRLISSEIIAILETVYCQKSSVLEQGNLAERGAIILDECLAWLREHCPDVDIKGASGDNAFEVCEPPENPWDRWDESW